MSRKLFIALLISVVIICSFPFAYRIYSLKPQSKYISKEISDPAGDISAAIDNVYKSAVTVRTDVAEGSGNIWNISPSYIDIVTAFHIIEGDTPSKGDGEPANSPKEGDEGRSFGPCEISFYDELNVEGSVLRYNKEKDIALVRVPMKRARKAAKELGLEGPKGYNSVRIYKDDFYAQDDIFIQDGRTGTVAVGFIGSSDEYIPDFDMNMIYCLCDVDPGMSGGGLFDARGNYLGLLLGGSEDGAVCLCVDQFDF